MAVDKLIDSTIENACRTAEANAIRAKTGSTAQITYDWANSKGFADAIESIETGITPTGNIELAKQSGNDVTQYASASVRSASVSLNTPTVDANGLITASATVDTSGWIGSAPSSATKQLSTQAATAITPTESSQTAVESGKYTTGAVTVNPISSTYVGSDITRRSSSSLTASGATVSVPAGYYSTAASKSVSTTTHPNPTASINTSTGVVTASHTQSSGYVTGSTTTGTLSLTTQAAKTVTPSASSQTAVAAQRYTTGAVTVAAVPSETKTVDLNMASGNQVVSASSGKWMTSVTVNKPATLLPENIKKDVNIGGVVGTMESGGGTLITKTITQNGTYNASDDNADGYSQVTVNVSGGGGLPELPLPSTWSGTTFTLDKDYQISQPDPELEYYWELPDGYTLNIPSGTKLVVQGSAEEFDILGTIEVHGELLVDAYVVAEGLVNIANGYVTIHNSSERIHVNFLDSFPFGVISFYGTNVEARIIGGMAQGSPTGRVEVFGSFYGYSIGTVSNPIEFAEIYGSVSQTSIYTSILSTDDGGHITINENATVLRQMSAANQYSIIVSSSGVLSYLGDDYEFVITNLSGTINGIPQENIENWQRV